MAKNKQGDFEGLIDEMLKSPLSEAASVLFNYYYKQVPPAEEPEEDKAKVDLSKLESKRRRK